MVLKLEKKIDIVNKINNTAKKARSLIIAYTAGLKVNSLNKLRLSCRKTEEIHLYSTRNSLMMKGLQNTDFCIMQYMLKGQCIIGFSLNTIEITAKVFNDFSKNIDNNLLIKGVCVEKKIFQYKDIDILLKLPNYEGALLKFLYILKYISVGKLYILLDKLLLKNKLK